MSERLLARTAMVGGIVFAILSFADHNPSSSDIWLRQVSHGLGERLGIVRPLPGVERPSAPSAPALDSVQQTLRPDGTRLPPIPWPGSPAAETPRAG